MSITAAEADRLAQEWEAECDVLHEEYCERQLSTFLQV